MEAKLCKCPAGVSPHMDSGRYFWSGWILNGVLKDEEEYSTWGTTILRMRHLSCMPCLLVAFAVN